MKVEISKCYIVNRRGEYRSAWKVEVNGSVVMSGLTDHEVSRLTVFDIVERMIGG